MEVWLKRNCWLHVIVCGSFSNVAQAHGEDILVLIYTDLLSIVLCMTMLLSWRRARAHRVAGLIGCMAGTICGNLAVSRLPYTQYEILITAVGFIAPIAATIAATMLAIYGARRHASDAKRR